MTRLVKSEGRICPRIESSTASHTVASPERGLSDRKPFISGSGRSVCSTNRLTITTLSNMYARAPALAMHAAQAPTPEMAVTPPSIRKSAPTTYVESSDAR